MVVHGVRGGIQFGVGKQFGVRGSEGQNRFVGFMVFVEFGGQEHELVKGC